MRTLAWLGACLAVVASAASPSPAGAVPNLLPYQGRLTTTAGAPITGSHSVQFALYSGAALGLPLDAADHDFSLTMIVKTNDVRWIIVNADGTVLAQSGGFRVFKRGAGQTSPATPASASPVQREPGR